MNLANKLTMLRVLLVPVFIIFMIIDSFWANIIALLIFIAASITDYFDGAIARKQNTITTLGIFLDPLADKLLVTSAFISFVGIYTLNVPAWMVICIIAREFIITGLRSIAASKNIIIPASMAGKVKTTSTTGLLLGTEGDTTNSFYTASAKGKISRRIQDPDERFSSYAASDFIEVDDGTTQHFH